MVLKTEQEIKEILAYWENIAIASNNTPLLEIIRRIISEIFT